MTLATGQVLRQIHHHSRDAIWFGRRDGTWRFDDPSLTYGVIYLGRTTDSVLAEVLLRDPTMEIFLWSDVEARREALIRNVAPLQLATLHGPGLSYFRVQQADVVGPSYTVPQDISSRIHIEGNLDGIQYRSRFDSDELCIALFERAAHKIELLRQSLPLDKTMVRDFLRARGKRLAAR